MTDVVLDAVPHAIKGWIARFVRKCKIGKHLPECIDKCVDFLFGFKPHHLFLHGRAGINLTVLVGPMQHKTGQI